MKCMPQTCAGRCRGRREAPDRDRRGVGGQDRARRRAPRRAARKSASLSSTSSLAASIASSASARRPRGRWRSRCARARPSGIVALALRGQLGERRADAARGRARAAPPPRRRASRACRRPRRPARCRRPSGRRRRRATRSITRRRPRSRSRRPARRPSRSRPGRARRRGGAARARACRRRRAPGGADRMPERDRAAVDVDALGIDAEIARRLQRDRGEGLVDLDHVHVGRGQAGALERDLRGLAPARARASRGGSRCSPSRGCARAARGRRSRASSASATTSIAAPSLTPGELPAVCVGCSGSSGAQRGEALERRVAARAPRRCRRASARRARGPRRRRSPRPCGPSRSRRPRAGASAAPSSSSSPRGEPELVGDGARLLVHQLAAPGIAQAVVQVRVDQLAVAEAVARSARA